MALAAGVASAMVILLERNSNKTLKQSQPLKTDSRILLQTRNSAAASITLDQEQIPEVCNTCFHAS
jgi:hypothetical protein